MSFLPVRHGAIRSFQYLVTGATFLALAVAAHAGTIEGYGDRTVVQRAVAATSPAWKLPFEVAPVNEASHPWSIHGLMTGRWPTFGPYGTAGVPAGTVDPLSTGSVRAGMFGSVAIPFGNLSAARRWKPIYAAISRNHRTDCNGDQACTERKAQLAETIELAREQSFLQRLDTINRFVNRSIGYATDREIYGQTDYWAKPSETIINGRGDCEDYAILKMAALKAAGVPASSMSLVVLRDRKRDLFHAVLAVTTDRGHFILDNVHDRVLVDADIPRYQPLYSLSQDRSWIHGYRRSGENQIATGYSLDRIAPGEGATTMRSSADGVSRRLADQGRM